LFLAFFIIRAVPSGSPLNIDLYRDNTIISLAIYNPAELSYRFNSTKETLEYPVEDDWNNNWNDNEDQDNNEGWNHANDWTPGLGNQPQLNTPEWIDWVFAYISLDQIREIADISLHRISELNMKPNMEFLSASSPQNPAFLNSKRNLSKKPGSVGNRI
jgi:hypothetical protein